MGEAGVGDHGGGQRQSGGREREKKMEGNAADLQGEAEKIPHLELLESVTVLSLCKEFFPLPSFLLSSS